MNKTVTYVLSWSWMLHHLKDEVSPIQKIREFLQENLADKITIIGGATNALELKLSNDLTAVELKNKLSQHLSNLYDDFNDSALDFDYKASTEKKSQADDASKDVKDVADEIEELLQDLEEEKPLEGWQKVLNDIDNVISGEEFKALAHEVALIAPQLKTNGTQNLFMQQNYLFSINDGCGMSNYLKLYIQLLNELGICKLYKYVYPLKLRVRKNSNDDPLGDAISTLERKSSQSLVICLDMCDWMNEINTAEFKEFLSNLKETCTNSIVVFRIPFVDKEVMANISKALNDVMFIRPMSFPPYTMEEIALIAEAELDKYGFEMDSEAWKGFNNRIREESSDGRFYGEDTVKKVVSEMLYVKQLNNAKAKSDSKTLTLEDTEQLCKSNYFDNRSGIEMLDSLVGTEAIKTRILEIISQIELIHNNKEMGNPCLHMRFVGNPGTGKTTVARIIGKILKEKNILRVGEFYEHGGRDFVGRYIGETAPKTLSMCREAYGSVLFIDEAYSLFKGAEDVKDFGREALDTLIAEMENHRSDFVVIMAGYTDEMNHLMKGNAGLASRMPYTIEFPNFTREQLYDIFVSMCKLPCEDNMLDDVKQYFLNLDEAFINTKEFSNARYVRNLYERVCAKAAMRCQLAGNRGVSLNKEDFARAISDKEFAVTKKNRLKIGFGN